MATHAFDDASPDPEGLFVPGGAQPTFHAIQNQALLSAIAQA